MTTFLKGIVEMSLGSLILASVILTAADIQKGKMPFSGVDAVGVFTIIGIGVVSLFLGRAMLWAYGLRLVERERHGNH